MIPFLTLLKQRILNILRLTYLLRVFYIRSRNELPYILNRQKLIGKGVEVGVWKGDYSMYILDNWKGNKLYSVDPWKSFENDEYVDDMNITQAEFDCIYKSVCSKLQVYGERSKIIKKISAEAVSDFEDNSLDFVYIDAMHDYNGVKNDIKCWYPKVKRGGLLCGHDYLNGVIGTTDFGVKDAVDEFVREKELKLSVTHKDKYPSWFVFKL